MVGCFVRRSLLAGAFLSIFAAGVHAQRGGPPMVQLPPMEVQGRFAAMVGPGVYRVVTDDREGWVVRLTEQTRVRVRGSAEESYLHPGLYVEFVAELDPDLQAVEPVEELTIFTPHERSQRLPGVFPEGRAPGEPGLQGPPEEHTDAATRRFMVVGRLADLVRGKYVVATTRTPPVFFDLAEEAKIGLDLADLGVAAQVVSPGDRIEARGGIQQPGVIIAAVATIELAEPLSGPSEPDPREVPQGRGARRPPREAQPPRATGRNAPAAPPVRPPRQAP